MLTIKELEDEVERLEGEVAELTQKLEYPDVEIGEYDCHGYIGCHVANLQDKLLLESFGRCLQNLNRVDFLRHLDTLSENPFLL